MEFTISYPVLGNTANKAIVKNIDKIQNIIVCDLVEVVDGGMAVLASDRYFPFEVGEKVLIKDNDILIAEIELTEEEWDLWI